MNTTYSPPKQARSAFLDLSAGDLDKYSLSRALFAAANGSVTRAPFESEISACVAERIGEPARQHAFYLPSDVLFTKNLHCRDMTSAGASGSQYLVGTDTLSFIDLLRARMVCMRLGAQMVTGLVGIVSLPRVTVDTTSYWLTNEATAITESQPTVGQITMSPKHVGAYTEISRLFSLQSKAQDSFLFSCLAKSVAAALDKAGLAGSGASGQPQGIIGAAGVGTFTGTSLAWAALIDAQADVFAGKEVDPSNCGYVFTPATATLLMAREQITGSGLPLWQGAHGDGLVGGCRAASTSALAAATGVFGDFSRLLFGEWGTMALEVNPFANFPAGVLGVRVLYAADVSILDASAFSTTSAIT